MKFINKFFLLSSLYLLSFSYALAVDEGLANPLSNTKNLQQFFDGIVSVGIQLGTILSGLAIMYGGFLYVTAQGDEEKIHKAYVTTTWALVGTAVLLGARVITLAIKGTVSQLN